jgi:hypothetical protein
MNDSLVLNLNPRELDLVAQALAQCPWHQVNALMVNIQNQVTAQQQLSQPQETHYADATQRPNGSGQPAEH